jgi:hypothetical protein
LWDKKKNIPSPKEDSVTDLGHTLTDICAPLWTPLSSTRVYNPRTYQRVSIYLHAGTKLFPERTRLLTSDSWDGYVRPYRLPRCLSSAGQSARTGNLGIRGTGTYARTDYLGACRQGQSARTDNLGIRGTGTYARTDNLDDTFKGRRTCVAGPTNSGT